MDDPVSAGAALAVLRAKVRLHLAVTVLPSLACSAVLAVLLRTGIAKTLLLLVTPVVCAYLLALLGLALNLLMPRLDWISEAQAVKRSGSAFTAIFGAWGSCWPLCCCISRPNRL